MKITFYGGARWVTGANYLLELGELKIIVDCGLFQGAKYAEDFNYSDFAYDPAEINYAFISHSHIDHIGRLPKLFRDGFRGRIITTAATLDLMKVALPDNFQKIEQEAREDGHPSLFEEKDISGLFSLTQGVRYGQEIDLGGGVSAVLHDAGHILGSASIEIKWPSDNIVFSGDLGNPPTPLLRPPSPPGGASYAVVESAYGDRIHEDRKNRKERLIKVVKETVERGGVLLMPSFAIERTQELLFEFNDLMNQGIIPPVPVFIDSPLAIKMTEVYKKHTEYFNETAGSMIKSGDDIFDFPRLTLTPTVEESKAINNVPLPKIIIAGSGMSQGGRIWHHELRYLPDPKCTIAFVGYQVEGSLGRRILDGAQEVTILGQKTPVVCRIENIGSYSGHADKNGLLEWVRKTTSGQGKKVFVVQGESGAAQSLAGEIKRQLNIEALAPEIGQSFEL